ncbi:MAG: hypothetical protein ACI8XO_002605 [Verrucomicrobiales bacterium]|jgi:hypothetical protein
MAVHAETSIINFESPDVCASKVEGDYIRIKNSRGTIWPRCKALAMMSPVETPRALTMAPCCSSDTTPAVRTVTIFSPIASAIG